jgi:hypothetical protein
MPRLPLVRAYENVPLELCHAFLPAESLFTNTNSDTKQRARLEATRQLRV